MRHRAFCLSSAAFALLAWLTPLEAQARREPREVDVTGQYLNRVYFYSLSIPPGLRGIRPGAPAPQHGISIELAPGIDDRILIDASYNSAELESIETMASSAMRSFVEAGLIPVSTTSTQLAGMTARESTLVRRDGKSRINYVRSLTAFRPGREKEVGMIYSIQLEQKLETAAGQQAFASIVRSFQLVRNQWIDESRPLTHSPIHSLTVIFPTILGWYRQK
jgi:hypothetical protein